MEITTRTFTQIGIDPCYDGDQTVVGTCGTIAENRSLLDYLTSIGSAARIDLIDKGERNRLVVDNIAIYEEHFKKHERRSPWSVCGIQFTVPRSIDALDLVLRFG